MKFCVQPPIRHPFALANFQLGRKGQRPKGRKVKRPNFQKLSEAFLIKSKVVPDVFMSIFKLKGPISRNFALELIVQRSPICCKGFALLEEIIQCPLLCPHHYINIPAY